MSRPRKTPLEAPAPCSAPALTADQLRIAQLFAQVDAKTQQFAMRFLETHAERERVERRPALHLVSGGAK